MLLLKQLNQLSDLQKVGWRHIRSVEEHHLNNLGLRLLINGQELFDVVSINYVFRVL